METDGICFPFWFKEHVAQNETPENRALISLICTCFCCWISWKFSLEDFRPKCRYRGWRTKRPINRIRRWQEPFVVNQTREKMHPCEGHPSNPDGSVYLAILSTKGFKIDLFCLITHTPRLGWWRHSRHKGNLCKHTIFLTSSPGRILAPGWTKSTWTSQRLVFMLYTTQK